MKNITLTKKERDELILAIITRKEKIRELMEIFDDDFISEDYKVSLNTLDKILERI